MNVAKLFTRWTEILAGFITDWRDASKMRRSMIVTQEDGRFVLRRADSAAGTVEANVVIGTKPPPDIAQSLRDRFIIFEMDADKIVTRRLSVPVQAQAFLPGIVHNQIERLSPWPPTQALYGIDAKPNPSDSGVLNVCVFIVARDTIDKICDELTESGLAPGQVVVRTKEDRSTLHTLWTRPAHKPRQSVRSLPRMIGISLASFVILSLAVSAWASLSANALSTERDDVDEQIRGLQHGNSAQKQRDLASLKPAERAWVLKENTPVAVLTLEALARALPDSVYLTELRLENTTLRLIGLATDAPSIIGALEQSGRFSQVHFFAPTTKGQSSNLYKFYIETRVEEHPRLIGD